MLDRRIAAAVKLGAGVLLREFRRHAQVRWLTPLGGLFCARLGVIGLVRGELLASVASLGMALLAVVLYGREVRSIDVGSIGLVLRAPFRSRVIPWREVGDVALVDVLSRTGPLQTARIHLHGGKPVDLNLFAEGAIPCVTRSRRPGDARESSRGDHNGPGAAHAQRRPDTESRG